MNLRPYQVRTLEQLDTWFAANPDGNPIVSACVGAGKSIMIAEFCRRAVLDYPDYRTRILMLVPSKELLTQNIGKLSHLTQDINIGIVSASLGRKDTAFDKDVVIATVGSVAKNPGQLGRLDIILVDECFAAGTMISTPNGDVPIEKIMPGDDVFNATGIGKVEVVRKSSATDVLKIGFSNERYFTVTKNHPIFTARGWKAAEELEVGEDIFSIEDVRILQKTILSLDKKARGWFIKKRHSRACLEQAKLLLNILLKESEQPNERQPSSYKNARNIAENKAQTHKAGWKWPAFAYSTTGFVTRAWRRLGVRISSAHKNSQRERLSNLLQTGYCESKQNDRNRAGWSNPFWAAVGHRQKEGFSFSSIRVESISCVKQEGITSVFNLRISGHPSYFANGILVHNCHLINRKETGQYRKLIADCQRYNPDLRVIGLTGTPFRGNGIWLTEGKERLFTDIAARVTMTELLDSGFLSPLVTADTGIQVSASEVRQSNGDYVVAELEKLLDDSELTKNIAKTIVSLGKDRNRWLVYGVTVAHATHLCEAINALGIRAEVVSAQTPAKERGRIINDFKRGKLRCLCNVAVLTTGFDVPELDLIALVRNTKSPVLYTQITGRGMRISDGKTDCLWLDFTDTTANMGPVDRVKGRGEPKAKDEPVDAPFKICPGCGSKLGTTALQCPVCGQEFDPPKPAINDTVSDANILSEDVFNTYPVKRVTYAYHKNLKNQDKPPTVKVTYWSYVNPIISEWVCLEHSGYAQAKAILWWQSRSDVPMPLSIDEFFYFNLADSLQQPVSITVKEGGEWPELIRCNFEHEPETIA